MFEKINVFSSFSSETFVTNSLDCGLFIVMKGVGYFELFSNCNDVWKVQDYYAI
jgi:hypothetical protein